MKEKLLDLYEQHITRALNESGRRFRVTRTTVEIDNLYGDSPYGNSREDMTVEVEVCPPDHAQESFVVKQHLATLGLPQCYKMRFFIDGYHPFSEISPLSISIPEKFMTGRFYHTGYFGMTSWILPRLSEEGEEFMAKHGITKGRLYERRGTLRSSNVMYQVYSEADYIMLKMALS